MLSTLILAAALTQTPAPPLPVLPSLAAPVCPVCTVPKSPPPVSTTVTVAKSVAKTRTGLRARVRAFVFFCGR